MNYLTSMGNMLAFNISGLQNGLNIKRLQYYAILNVLVLGVIYGCSAALFSRIVLVKNGFDATAYNPLKIIVAGIPVAFFMHAGAALFIWVFLKAIGGKADFLMSYFNIGMAAISLWLVAPFAAALQIGAVSPVITLLATIFALYAFAVNVRVIQAAFQLSGVKMTLATLVTLMYISCFLYLWV